MRDIIFAEIFIQMGNALGIRVRGQEVPSFQESFAQFLIVVNLSIKDHSHRAIFVIDRLASAIHVDDRQATHT